MNPSNQTTPGFTGNFPALPDELPAAADAPGVNLTLAQPLPRFETIGELGTIVKPPFKIRSVRCGCYLVNFKPTSGTLISYDGTIRVECHSDGRTASGDLYQRPVFKIPSPLMKPAGGVIIPTKIISVLGPAPSPAGGIPILPRIKYRYYLRITQILESITIANSFTLGFEMHRFTKAAGGWSAGGTWTNEGAFTAQMTWIAAPAGYPSANNYLEGDVKNSVGKVVGRLKMGWISTYLRKATVEVDRVAQSEAPLNNGAGVDWVAVGNSVNWDISVDVSDANVAEPSGISWSNGECHAAMLARRDASNLDAEWRYHVLAVRQLDATPRGIMYDNGATDSNNVPREGCALASHWTIPNDPEWGLVKNMRFGTAAAPYFRTAVHETGHAMGLYHNTADNGFMNTTDVIAGSATAAQPFPTNIQWAYASDDRKRLRHMPDIYVRPGGVPFGTSYATTPISPTDFSVEVDGLTLRVSPLLEAVPLGAPVRVNIELVNTSDMPVAAPKKLSMKNGQIRGSVTDASGNTRYYRPVMLCVDDHELAILKPGQSVRHAVTLLRGAEGALFPSAGMHQVTVEVSWDMDEGMEASVSGETTVMVTAPVDENHARAALKVLSTPDTVLTLVLGGDHLTDGIEAIQAALKNPVLRPHFAYIEAKRVAERFGKRKADLKTASDLIASDPVMSLAEIKKAAELIKASGADTASGKAVAKALKGKVGKLKSGDEVKELVESLL